MAKKQKSGFHLIFCPETLNEVIYFLEHGYGWSTENSSRLYQHLIKQAPAFPMAAVHMEKGEIVIGVLLFYQGYHADQMKNVINFSNWYAKGNYRGLEAIRFASDVTKALDEFIITCYTPMEAVCKILTIVKYEKMYVEKMMVGLSSNFPFILFKLPPTLLTLKSNLIKPKNIEDSKSRARSLERRDWLYKVHKVKIRGVSCSLLSLFGHGVNSKINVFWLLMIIIRYGIVRINIYTRTDEEPATDVWLMKNCGNERFISPANSEYVV